MSLVRPALNLWLRLTERPHLARASDPERLRKSFETKARLFFHAPRGTRARDGLLGDVPVRWLSRGADWAKDGARDAPLVFYLHGGGYVFGSPRTHAAMIAWLCKAAGARAVLPAYRKAPEHPHPAPIDDALAAYLALLDSGVPAGQVVLGGDSAGGGLALALLADILRHDHPVPAGVFAFSPLTDVSYSGASVQGNARHDVVLPAERVLDMTRAFIGEGDRTDPRASPLFADFTGAPPVWLVVGDTEILLDDTRRMAERLRAQAVAVDVTVAHDLPHVWPIFHNILPEARCTLRDLAQWIRARMPAG